MGQPLFPHQGQERIVGGRDNMRSLNAYDDEDGVIRRVPLGFEREAGGKLEPSFSVELAARALGVDPFEAQGENPKFGERPIVTDGKGNVLWTPQPARTAVLAPAEAWLVTDMLKDVVRRGTAYRAVWGAGFTHPAAGKTGTTNDGADVWFIGYTADLVAGVWMGFDKPQKIKANAQGGELAAPAWAAFMTEVYRRKPQPPDWPRPDGVIVRQVDALTGRLANSSCTSAVVTEFFVQGSEPTTSCTDAPPASRFTIDSARALMRTDTTNPFRLPPQE
jgi:penicillin-binding protein 1A